MMDLNEWDCLMGSDDRRPMNEEDTKIFLHTTLAEQQDIRGQGDVLEQLHIMLLVKSTNYAIMNARLESVGAKVGRAPMLFAAALCDDPGNAVMWAFTLNKMAIKASKPVDMDTFANYFPMGIPTDDGYHEVWESQKEVDSPLGNAIDRMDDWPRYSEEADSSPEA
jgi:hypothetical protein